MPEHCSYDCSRQPTKIEADSDITGTGVVVGYVAAAGIAVVLIIVHYILVYQPGLDPFRDDGTAGSSRAVLFQPNPVDLMIHRYIRRPFRAFHTVKCSLNSRWVYLNTALTRCILAMSDLQLATGIGIFISGYSQLRCGLSSYHWVVIGRLAWFSSLTHLSCLTLLRTYLHNRKSQRQWRLALMLVLIVMLITAIVPTGAYQWTLPYQLNFDSSSGRPRPSDYAICSFATLPPASPVNALLPMVVLVLLAGLGFIIRAIKLHKPLSGLLVKMRARISRGLRRPLCMLYRWKTRPRGLRRFTGDTLYYPALALFLSLRLVADHFASMFFEVYWLLASFLIGLWSLLKVVNALNPDPDFLGLFEGVSSNKWTFGQVMPVILLALPLINIIESFYPDYQGFIPSSAGTTPTDNISTNAPIMIGTQNTSPMVNPLILNPDQNYYRYTTAMGAGTVYILLCELGFLPFALTYGFVSTPALAITFLALGCIIPPIALWATVLVSLPIDLLANRNGTDWYLLVLQPANVVFISCVSGALTFALSQI